MCIHFSKSQGPGHCDILSHLANVVGNLAVAVVGGTSIAAVAYVALNALGYEALTASALAVAVPYIPVALTGFGLIPLVCGVVTACAITAMVISLASNRADPKPELDSDEELI